MSDLIDNVSFYTTDECDGCEGLGSSEIDGVEEPCVDCNATGRIKNREKAKSVIRTVLEEMLKDRRTLHAGHNIELHYPANIVKHEDGSIRDILGHSRSKECVSSAIHQFAKHNNITIGGENE